MDVLCLWLAANNTKQKAEKKMYIIPEYAIINEGGILKWGKWNYY